jgi:hypothetical protein
MSKIDDAIKIIISLGFPKAQHNERTAHCLLALLNLTEEKSWAEAEDPLIGITPIMQFAHNFYGKDYAPNTRESFRRQSMHQMVNAGIVRLNPDNPGRSVNSPGTVYQIEPATLDLLKTFGTNAWKQFLLTYLESVETLIEKYAMGRQMQQIPVKIAKGEVLNLSPGAHSILIKAIIEEFGSRFVPGGILVYAGDTKSKWGYFDKKILENLKVEIDAHGKMPDVVLYYPDKHWLLLIESVTSHGPVDGKRHEELSRLFKKSTAPIVYVTAFPSRHVMAPYLVTIAWETEVWCADAPEHLIHFNGDKFLGPHLK